MTLPSDLMTFMWSGFKVATPGNITYSFTLPVFNNSNVRSVVAMTNTQKNLVRDEIAQIAKVANVHFSEISGTATLNFGMADLSLLGAAGFTQATPNQATKIITHASIAIDTALYNRNSSQESEEILLHETLHGMAGFLDVPTTYSDKATVMNNNRIMLTNTPAIYDIAALQNIYGKNMATSGDTPWVASSFFNGNSPAFTIWDAGGQDYITAASLTSPAGFISYINLNSDPLSGESILSNGTKRVYFRIADGANIEGAIGTSGADVITGNALNNGLRGGGGDDFIYGNNGDDIIEGGAGVDTMEGNAGSDTLSYLNSSAAVQVNLAAGTATGGDAQGDVFTTFENLTGSAFNDSLTGDAGANTIDGGKGLNIIDGGGGADTLIGGTGTNNIHGGTGNDNINDSSSGGFIVLYGDDGDDFIVENGTAGGSLFGGTGNDILQNNSAVGAFMEGDDGSDQLTGGAGAELIWGGAGDDLLFGGAGADAFYYSLLAWPGNNGNDTIFDFQPGIDSFNLADDLYFDGTVHSNGNTILSIFNDGALDGTITVRGVTI